MTSPVSLHHYSAQITDLSTIIVTGHFIDQDDNVAVAFSTITLTQPLSQIDDSFLGDKANADFMPCDISEFYANSDDEIERAIMVAHGKNPDEEYARWAVMDEADEAQNQMAFYGRWIPVADQLPEEQEHVLVCNNQTCNAAFAMIYQGKWQSTEGGESPVSPVEFWSRHPETPHSKF